MRPLGIEKGIGDTAVVGEDDEPVRILVEPAERKDAFYRKDFFYFLFAFLRGVRDDAAWLVVGEVSTHWLAPFHFHLVLLLHLVAEDRRAAVQNHKPLFDELVGLAARAELL